jgi:hypothetical protein
VVPALAALFGLLMVPQVMALVRRPTVMADHYALTVRPGVGRTLVLPWAQVAELAVRLVDEEPLLFIRCDQQPRPTADWPRWWDQGHLRSAQRGTAALAAYHLAVPMDEFLGTPASLLEQLDERAAPHVVMVNGLA